MLKEICDKCEQILTEKNRKLAAGVPFKVEVGRQHHTCYLSAGASSSGTNQEEVSLCKYCIVDLISTMDDRPRPGSLIDSGDWAKLLLVCNIRSKNATMEDVLRHVSYLKEHAKQSIAASSP